jgi:chorismate mutase
MVLPMTDTGARSYGKRRLSEARGKFVAVRCSDTEHATLTASAERAGLSVGAYLRTIALGQPGPRAVRRPAVEKEVLARLLGELGKLGSNVNQIARAVNTTGNLPSWSELAAIRGELTTLRAALLQALGRSAGRGD